MGRNRSHVYFPLITLIFLGSLLLGGLTAAVTAYAENNIYLPVLNRGTMVEFRGLWITRFEWAIGKNPTPADIDRIVNNAATAGFNALLFQVRGTADAYYPSPVEPWAAALGGSLGVDPGWDPLAHMITAAHARGLQVHAYINAYPVWPYGSIPPETVPRHLYHKLADQYGMVEDKVAGLQWNQSYEVPQEFYLRATPASFLVDEQLLAVTRDLVSRYDLDGIHLDNIRYGGRGNSCDPVTEARIGGPCFTTVPEGYASFEDWQRAQVNGTVYSVYQALFGPDENGHTLASPDLLLSAAVWPFYESGYHNYYQDSKAWLAGGYIDSLMPMLYGSFDDDVAAWQQLAAGFQADNAGRYVIPGIHGNFESFADIAGRIAAARQVGAAGHSIFAYSYLENRGYFDDLAAGPYSTPAVPPRVTWHP